MERNCALSYKLEILISQEIYSMDAEINFELWVLRVSVHPFIQQFTESLLRTMYWIHRGVSKLDNIFALVETKV